MNEERNDSLVSRIFGWIIGIPILIVFVIVVAPILIYKLAIDDPIQKRKKRKFIAQHTGKVVLCITNSSRYRFIDDSFRDGCRLNGITEIIVFNGSIPNNTFHDFDWDILVDRSIGFPQLIFFLKDKMESISLKGDFITFFKREINQTQLLEIIGTKLRSLNYGK